MGDGNEGKIQKHTIKMMKLWQNESHPYTYTSMILAL